MSRDDLARALEDAMLYAPVSGPVTLDTDQWQVTASSVRVLALQTEAEHVHDFRTVTTGTGRPSRHFIVLEALPGADGIAYTLTDKARAAATVPAT